MAKRKRAMRDDELVTLIEERESRADRAGTIGADRAKALRYYQGDRFGNEVEGRSQVVMREVYSTIEWIKPALMRIFFGGDSICKFTPRGPEDEAAADQESDYINHVILEKNPGFELFYSWFTDAMLSKNAYMVAFWDDRQEVRETRYDRLSPDEAAYMVGAGLDIAEATQNADGSVTLTVRRSDEYGCVRLAMIPPERVRVEANWKSVSLAGCPFFEYWENKTISQLREEGFEVEDSISDDSGNTEGAESVLIARFSKDATYHDDVQESDTDPASREVRVRTAFLRVDYDRDGIAEMRRVVVVGRTVLVNEVTDCIPAAALTPNIMPHRHVGISVAESVQDLQEIKSTLVRGQLDNMYLSNNGRYAVDQDRVNLDDMLQSRPGGVVRVSGPPGGAIEPLTHIALPGHTFQMLEYLDMVLENRTGASPRVLQGQSFDGNSINKTASGLAQVMSAAMARIELIARVFAETGVKDLMLVVHELTLKHARKAEIIRLRNRYVQVDPRYWQRRKDMVVSVGLGSGDRQSQIANIQQLMAFQMGPGLQLGISTPMHVYNSAAKWAGLLGYKNPDEFVQQPQPPAPQGQAPDMRGQAAMAEVQRKALRDRAEIDLENRKAAQEAVNAERDRQQKTAEALMKINAQTLRAPAL